MFDCIKSTILVYIKKLERKFWKSIERTDFIVEETFISILLSYKDIL